MAEKERGTGTICISALSWIRPVKLEHPERKLARWLWIQYFKGREESRGRRNIDGCQLGWRDTEPRLVHFNQDKII